MKNNFLKKIMVLSVVIGSIIAVNASAVLPYSKENKLNKELHKGQSYASDYEEGGVAYRKKYEGLQEKNGVPFSKEGVADGDIITCLSGNENLAVREGTKRKFHSFYGAVGEEGTVLEDLGSSKGERTPYDMTSIKNFDEVMLNYADGFRDNSGLQRYCNSAKLKDGDNGEYDVNRIYCDAGMETTVFLGFVQDPYTLQTPTCKLTLDTDIKIDEVRYLRQVIAPDNASGDVNNNYSMGNGLVKCSVKNGKTYLEMLDNPSISTVCDETNFATFDGGKGCCNPTTGFGCNAQFCQYGSDKYCSGETIPDVGSCKFDSKATIFVKGLITVTGENGVGSGTFKCLENGSWLTQTTSGC